MLSSRSNHEFWSIGEVRWSSRRWQRRWVRLVIVDEVRKKLSKRHSIESDLVEEVQSKLEEACGGYADKVDGVCDFVKEGDGFLRLGLGEERGRRKVDEEEEDGEMGMTI